MEVSELRQFSADELKGRIRQWQEELFRARFKGESTETKDTSVFGKLRKDIARAQTVLSEKSFRGSGTAPIQPKPEPHLSEKASEKETEQTLAPVDRPVPKKRTKKAAEKAKK